MSTNAIYRMHLNGTKRERFLEDGIGIVDGELFDAFQTFHVCQKNFIVLEPTFKLYAALSK